MNMESDPGGPKKVLVLNTTFAPINICSWRRAVTLLFKNKAESVEASERKINGRFILPFVIRLKSYVPLPYNSVVLTRKNVLLRDNFTCQYCGSGGNLTLDHIMPKSRGGEDSWENIVVCCVRCNNRKGDRAPEEVGLKLSGTPYKPPSMLYLQMTRLSNIPKSWFNYFFGKQASN